jgi:hypothetical protein
MLFLLTDEEGRALLIAESGSKAEADAFGRNHLPEFCGESLEIDPETYTEAVEFWDVRTVRLVDMVVNPDHRNERRYPLAGNISFTWVRGPELPQDVIEDDLLTAEDHRDLTRDHIARTSDLIGRIRIVKKGVSILQKLN